MTIDPVPLLALPAVERLQLAELLWDSLSGQSQDVPVPDWAVAEANRRRSELLRNPAMALTYEQVWQNVSQRNDGQSH